MWRALQVLRGFGNRSVHVKLPDLTRGERAALVLAVFDVCRFAVSRRQSLKELAYEVLRPRTVGEEKRAEGVVIVDSFTALRHTSPPTTRTAGSIRTFGKVWQCLGGVLDEVYAETGRVVVGVAVPGASFGSYGRTRFARIVEAFLARRRVSWIVVVSMGNDAYYSSTSLAAVVEGIRDFSRVVSGCPVFVAYGGAASVWEYPPGDGYDGRVFAICEVLASHGFAVSTGVAELAGIPRGYLADRVGHFTPGAFPYVSACIRAWVVDGGRFSSLGSAAESKL